MDQDQKGRGAPSGFAFLSRGPDEAGARRVVQGGCRADHGNCVHASKRRRRAARQCSADHVRGARPHPKGHRQAARIQLFHADFVAGLHGRKRHWDVAYDARGHFTEPHDNGKNSFGIGTLEVRNYLAGFHDPSFIEAGFSQSKVETNGPKGNFGAVLFIEKEGFAPLFRAAQIAEKFDIAIMSTKGMSVVAARVLADEMCSQHDIPLLLLHDFDKAGFSIAGTLQRDTRRYEFQNSIEVVDLGLSLADVAAMELESEYQHHPKGRKSALIANLQENGASHEEIVFMFRDFDRLRSTRRVELNAMTSPQFVAYVERKLRENGIAKVVPDQDLLAEVYTGMERGRRLEDAAKELGEIDMEGFESPEDLEKRVKEALEKKPHIRWDAAIEAIVAEAAGHRDNGHAGAPPADGVP